MKRLITTLAIAFAAVTVWGTPASELRERLAQSTYQGKTLFGHHDDPVYGHTWRGEEGRSDILEVTGEYPAVMSWDLGMLEMNSDKNLDGVSFERMRQEVRNQHNRGGVNTFSWHLRNPLTGHDSWTIDTLAVSNLVNTPEGVAAYSARLDKLCDFFLSLTDDDGNRIGVIFRPWHEHTGGWFWWGKPHCSVEDYKALWRMMYDHFNQRGVDNVLWAYSPDRCPTEEDYMERYPGDDIIDILGADIYHFDGERGTGVYRDTALQVLRIAKNLAQEKGKLHAFTETGLESIPIEDWYTTILLPIIRESGVSYVTVWRNAWNNPKHFYTPYSGHKAENDFKKFHNQPDIIFVK